jgi:SAM-dependent methyltransferase
VSCQNGRVAVWERYLESFHAHAPGITESVLSRAVADGGTVYDWTVAGVPPIGRIIDLGSGSGPLSGHLAGRDWVGADRSVAELRVAMSRGRRPAVACRAEVLPFAAATFGGAVACLSLMTMSSPLASIQEVARVLQPGGYLVVTVPANGPLTLTDRWRYAQLLMALRLARFPFPSPLSERSLLSLLRRGGLDVVDVAACRFAFPVNTPGDAELFLRSLYLPSADPRRRALARRIILSWRGSSIGIPMRRSIARSDRISRGPSDRAR